MVNHHQRVPFRLLKDVPELACGEPGSGNMVAQERLLALSEMRALVRDLEACESPRTCPHGRPTMLQIGVGQLEKQFGRLG